MVVLIAPQSPLEEASNVRGQAKARGRGRQCVRHLLMLPQNPAGRSSEGNAQKAPGAPMPIEALQPRSPNTSRRALLHRRSRRVHPHRDLARSLSQCAGILPRMAAAHMVSAAGLPMMLGTNLRRKQRQQGEVDLPNPPLDKYVVAPLVLQPQQSV